MRNVCVWICVPWYVRFYEYNFELASLISSSDIVWWTGEFVCARARAETRTNQINIVPDCEFSSKTSPFVSVMWRVCQTRDGIVDGPSYRGRVAWRSTRTIGFRLKIVIVRWSGSRNSAGHAIALELSINHNHNQNQSISTLVRHQLRAHVCVRVIFVLIDFEFENEICSSNSLHFDSV